MNYITLGLLCSAVLVSYAKPDQLTSAIDLLDPRKVELLLKTPVIYDEQIHTRVDAALEQCRSYKPTRSEKILGAVSGACGLGALVSTAMYINDWGSMRNKVAKSRLGHRGFKTLAGPMMLLSCIGLYKRWSAPRKRLEKALEIKKLLDTAQLS